jgi:hypothetical protein
LLILFTLVELLTITSSFRGNCSFWWCWWNCWPSLFKLSFHNINSRVYKLVVYDVKHKMVKLNWKTQETIDVSVLYRRCNLSSQYKKNITTKNNDVNRLRQSLNLTNKHLLPRCYHIKQHTNSKYSNVWVIYNYMINQKVSLPSIHVTHMSELYYFNIQDLHVTMASIRGFKVGRYPVLLPAWDRV